MDTGRHAETLLQGTADLKSISAAQLIAEQARISILRTLVLQGPDVDEILNLTLITHPH